MFESFGLGKTLQELEFCRQVIRHEGGRALIVCPLGVRQEFHHDAVELLGMEAPRYITRMDELNEGYFRDAVGYLEAEEAKVDTPTLFDMMENIS